MKKYDVWAHFLNNINKRESLEKILEGITELTETPYFQKDYPDDPTAKITKEEAMKLPKSSFQAIKPPPKPKRQEWEN